MLQKQIELLRNQLHVMISQNESYDKIYKKSVELDILINQYYSTFSDII
ncbi:MAG: aspartyl-phosphate phosphatase Spo0E family protein [Bacillota bacterium]